MDGEDARRALVPADVDTPDKILYGLTVRQVAILAGTATVLWAAYHALTPLLAPIVVLVAAVPVAAVAVGVAVGRRDGIGMDRWVAAALASAWAPKVLVAAGSTDPDAAMTATGVVGRRSPVPLRLPATRIAAGGVVDLDGSGRVAVTAVSTVNFDLRTGAEQAALLEAAGHWLNSLTGPTQIVVSTRRVDLDAHAQAVEQDLDALPHPALVDAARGYAAFVRQLAEQRDPLLRRIVVAHRAGTYADAGVARRAAEHTARALSGIGATPPVLDGGAVTDVLAAACRPWQPSRFGRAVPDAVVTSEAGVR